MLVTAGPGSGKTTVITHRILYLIHSLGISPEQILVITFTKAAAGQMKERFRMLSEDSDYPVCFSTFHAFFYRVIREENIFERLSVLTETDKKIILNDILHREGYYHIQSEFTDELLRQISLVKNQRISIDEYEPLYFDREFFVSVFKEYQSRAKNAGKVDFDDMMQECYRLLMTKEEILKRWQDRFLFYLIDEFQDINPLQYEIMRLITGKSKNIFCVGDEDQSIYGFRGSSPKLMFRFLEDFPETEHVMMTRNYRSDGAIIEKANQIIQKNKERFDKNPVAVQSFHGNCVTISCFHNQTEEYTHISDYIRNYIEHNPKDSVAILFRTNQISQELTDCMRRENLSLRCSFAYTPLCDEEITKDILAYLELANGNLTHTNIQRIINKPVRYLSKTLFSDKELTWNGIEQKAKGKLHVLEQLRTLKNQLSFLRELPLYAAVHFIRKGIGYENYILERDGANNNKDRLIFDELEKSIKKYDDYRLWKQYLLSLKEEKLNVPDNDLSGVDLITLHASKGLEWDLVVIPDIIEGNLPFHKAETKDALEEERRIFYVGMTRAKKKLCLFSVKNDIAEKKPSVYYKELLK